MRRRICNAKELAFSAVSEIPSRDLREARKASSEAIRFPAKSKVHMIAIAICDYSLGLIQDKPVASLTVSESETVSRCRVIGPMPPAPESLRER